MDGYMKDKKMIILYVMMLVVGFALLLTNSSTEKQTQVASEETNTTVVAKTDVPEIITVAIANSDISKGTILTSRDYAFKNIEVNKSFDKNKYVSMSSQIDTYVIKNNIASGTLIERSFIVSPQHSEYISFALENGTYLFPFILNEEDIYLTKNLSNGDLIDIYVFYGVEQSSSRSGDTQTYVSPSRAFLSSNIKPIIVGKKILFTEDTASNSNNKKETSRIYVALTDQELKLVRTLMTNATLFIYPSIFNENMTDDINALDDEERTWPVSEQRIFNQRPVSKLRGS